MKKGISLLLITLILLVSLVAFPASAVNTGEDSASVTTGYSPGDEIIELRDQYSKTTMGEDDNFVLISYIGSIHYEDVGGNFQPINTMITPSRKPFWDWEVETGHWQLYIKNDTTVQVKKGNNWVGHRLHGLAYLDVVTKEYKIIQTVTEQEPVVIGNTVKWENLLYGLDYVIRYTNDSFKEDIIIKQPLRDILNQSGYRPSDFGLNPAATYLVPIYEVDWSQSLPMRLRSGQAVNPDEAEHEQAIYFESPIKDKYFDTNLVSFFPLDYAISANPINPDNPEEEWEYASEPIRKRLIKKNDKHWLLTGVLVSKLNQMPEGAIVFDPTETLRPDAAGDEESIASATSGVGSHYLDVDEAVADEDTSVVYTESGTYERDLYNLPASSGSGTINSIKIYFRCRADGLGNFQASPSLKSNSTVTDGTEVSSDSINYATNSQQWNTNPADGQPWGSDWSVIDALQIGVSLKQDFNTTAYCTQVYVEVDYTAPTPTVTTQAVDNTANTTATGHGTITDVGAENCDIRGFQVGTSTGVYTDNFTTSGNYTAGAYTGSLTGLLPKTTYYYRAEAHNSFGWGYGDELTFDTHGSPTVTTVVATSVKKTSAQLNGNIVSVNGRNADERGFEWGTATGNYTDNWTESNSFEAGVFNHTPTLVENTTYYFRALAHNDYGWDWGDELSFETLGVALWFQPNAIIIGTTLPDRAGNNDGVITWGSNPADVSANFSSFQTTAEAKAPAYALEEAPAFIETVPEIVSTWVVTPEAGTFPLAGVVRAIAAATDTPAQLPLLIIAAFVIIACSLAISATMRRYGSGSLIVKSAAITALMGVFIAIGNFGIDFWMLFVFLIIALALAMASRQTTWQ